MAWFWCVIVFVIGQEVIEPYDSLLSKSIYGASSVLSHWNSSEIEFFSFSGIINPEIFQSSMSKVRIQLTDPPFITTDNYFTDIYPADRAYYGIFDSFEYIYLFGGQGKDKILNDFWKFNKKNEAWAELRDFNQYDSRYAVQASYDFASTSFTKENLFNIVIIGGINKQSSANNDCNVIIVNETNDDIVVESCQDYTECTEFGISGAQVKYFNDSLYLFSGVNSDYEEFRYFTGICRYDFGRKLWERIGIDNELVGANRGGSVIDGVFIYYFFGSIFTAGGEYYNPDVFAFDMTHPALGWVQLLSNSTTGYDSFNYIHSNGTVFILGGRTTSGVSKSLIQLSLQTGSQQEFRYKSPSRRIGSSFLRSSTSLYLFAGEGEYFYHNSLWKYNPTRSPYSITEKWEKVSSIFSAPPSRKFSASASQGDFLLIAGGIGQNNEFFNDFWLLDTRYWKWVELVPSEDSERPPGFAYACIVLKVPYIYLIGGLNNQRVVMKTVWQYDLTKDKIVKMQNLTSEEFPKILQFGCQYEKSSKRVEGVKKVKQSIFVYFGERNTIGSLHCGVGRLDIVKDSYEFTNLVRPNKMPCRSSAAYYYEKNKLVVVGGKGHSDKIFKDIWVLNLNETHVVSEEMSQYTLQHPVYSSAYTNYNRSLYLFSGFNSNANSLVSRSSDLVFKVGLKEVLQSNDCDIGFENVNGTCQLCPIGSFASKINTNCEKCEPVGTLTTTEGATAGIQCLTEVDYLSSSLTPYIEKSLGFNFSEQDQAPIYQAPNLIFFYVFFGAFMVLAITSFLGAFLSFNKFSAFFIKKNLLREKKLKKKKELVPDQELEEPLIERRIQRKDTVTIREIAKKSIEDDIKKKEIKRTKKIKMTYKNQFKIREYFGGFLTGLIIISVIGILIYLPVDYFNNNKKEKVELIPTATFLNQFKTKNNSLSVNIITYPFNYGDCSVDLTYSEISKVELANKTVSYLNEKNQSIPFACHIHIALNKSTVYENDYLNLKFHNKNIYAKNMFIWIESKSSKPGYISRYMQQVKSDKGKSFDGLEPTVFKFLLVPAYYEEESYFLKNSNNSGIVVHSNTAPSAGSQVLDPHLSVGSSLSLKIALTGSESSMITTVYLQVGLIKFLSILSAQIVGIFGIFGGLYLAFQFIRKKCNERRKRLEMEKKELLLMENYAEEYYEDDQKSEEEKFEDQEVDRKKE